MFRDFMSNRVEQLLQEVKAQSKAMGTDVDGYQPRVARSGSNVLAFVFYPTGDVEPDKEPILIALEQTTPIIKISPPYKGSDYCIQGMLWKMGADGHSVQEDAEKTRAS
jgi:hypothetical protein